MGTPCSSLGSVPRRAGVLWPLEAGRFVVFVEVGLEGEGLVALLATVVLERRVGLHVGTQVGAVSKGLPAVGTPKGLLPGVRAHVSLQQPRPAEGLAAHGTLVFEVVGQQVHRQRRHGDVGLAARRALARQLAIQAAVRLLVPAEVGGGGVGLAAFGAGVAVGPPARTLGPPAGPPVNDEEGVHGVALGDGRLALEVVRGQAGLGALGIAVVLLDRGVEGVRRGPLAAGFLLFILVT